MDNFRSAQQLRVGGHWPSAVSRAYYAAYAAGTHALRAAGVRVFAHGRHNPSHAQLPRQIRHQLMGMVGRTRSMQVARALRRLLAARVAADYQPGLTTTRETAVASLRDASQILTALGILSDADR